MLEIKNISKIYGKRVLFSNFSCKFGKTGLVAIVGHSGSGKSTLLNILSGIDKNYDGNVYLDGTNIKKLNGSKLSNFRLQNIGYVFQNFNLLNLDSVFNNVLLPLDTISHGKKMVKKQRVTDVLKLVGMNDKSKQNVNKLSGGEKQRTAIARAIVNNPSLILCDEPTGALDEKNSELIFSLLKQISEETLVVVATHDVNSIKKIADYIISFNKNNLIVNKLQSSRKKEKSLLISVDGKKHKPKVSMFFKVRYALQKLKSKKYRSLIMNLMLSLSLTGIGLSLLLSNSVSTKVEEAFSAMLNGNQLIVSRRNENEPTFSNTYSTSYKNVYKIYEKYSYMVDGIGVNYMVNFEDFFKTDNDFYVDSANKRIPLESLSARNINDFRWIDENSQSVYYPFQYELLDDDQIILGLSYADMTNLCYKLQIQRNYSSLGHYIYEHGLMLSLNVRNDFWEYDDEQLLSIVAVCEMSSTSICHTNLLWNEIVFEEMMRLPSDDDEEHEFPWEMYKIYFLQTKENPSFFLDAVLKDEELETYVFERTNFRYNPSICKPYDVCDNNKIYVYSADKKSIICSELDEYKNNSKICDCYYTSDYGYASYSSNLFSGFSRNVFVSDDKDKIDEAIDAETKAKNEDDISLKLPSNVIQGNFLLSLNGGLRFSTEMSKLIYGRKPSNLNEIVISKGLSAKLDKNELYLGKYLEIAGEIEQSYNENGELNKIYNSTKLLVVGIVDESENYLYHFGYWTISFFRDKLGISNFLLIPKSIVFEFAEKSDAENAFENFKKLVTNYKVESPIEELKSSIESTLDYANTILVIFSILSFTISVLLLGTIVMLNIIESKNDISLFSFLGICKNDIQSCFVYQSVIQGLISFFVSAFELVFVDLFLSFAISKTLGTSFNFSLNSKPVFIIFLISIFVPIVITKFMLLMFKKNLRIS